MTSDYYLSPRPGPSGAHTSAPSLLTVNEVATMLRVSKMSVYRLVHAGELPHIKVSHGIRIPTEEVDALLERSYRPPVQPDE